MIKARLKSSLRKLAKTLPHQAKIIATVVAAVITVSTFPTQFVNAVEIYDSKEGMKKVYTFSNDTENILSSADISLDSADNVTVRGGRHGTDVTITIDRAFSVNVKNGEKITTVKLTKGTVADAIAAAGYTLDEYDIVTPLSNTELSSDMDIEYTNIDIVTTRETVTIPHKTKTKKVFNLKKGQRKTVQDGVDGQKTVTTMQTFINGVLTETDVNESLDRKAVTEKVRVGATAVAANRSEWISDLTPSKKIMLDENGVPTKYSKKMTGVASAYCTGTTCSTGVKVKAGYIAVDPSIIPYGTEMYIRTPDGSYIYGLAIAADTGGFTSWGNTIADLYMYSYEDCINFGRRNIEIYFI